MSEIALLMLALAMLVLTYSHWKLSKDVGDIRINTNGMGILLQHLLEAVGIEKKQWIGIMRTAVKKQVEEEHEALGSKR